MENRIHPLDAEKRLINDSIRRMFTTTFMLVLFFFCNPFGAYLVFKNK